MHTCTSQFADQMSNSLDHYQTAPDLGVHCLLRYISVPIFGVNTVSYFAASVKNTIYLLKYIVLIQNSVAPGQLYASLGISSSPLLMKKSMGPHLPKRAG